MTSEFFFTTDLDDQAGTVDLGAEETHHLRRVLRKQSGDLIFVFNGKGTIAESQILMYRGDKAQIKIIRFHHHSPAIPELNLVIGVPKREESFDLILRSATELGIRNIYPVMTHRSRRQVTGDNRTKRWQKIILNACKQCHQPWLPTLMPPVALQDLFEQFSTESCYLIVGVEPQVLTGRKPVDLPAILQRSVCWIVGPEGGWSETEQEILKRYTNFEMSLGSLILTVPIAVIAGLTIIKHHLNLI